MKKTYYIAIGHDAEATAGDGSTWHYIYIFAPDPDTAAWITRVTWPEFELLYIVKEPAQREYQKG